MLGTAGEGGMNSLVKFSYRAPTNGRQEKTPIHQLCADTRCWLEDLPRAMDDRNGWRERERERERESSESMLSEWLEDDETTNLVKGKL